MKDSVWEYGPLFEEERIGELMYNATVCVSPGNVGLTAMHCLMYGLPVITHDNFVNQMPECEAVKEGESGLFFKENDVDDLASKVENWLYSSKDISRGDIASKCHQIIDDKYNPEYQISVIENVIKSRQKCQ